MFLTAIKYLMRKLFFKFYEFFLGRDWKQRRQCKKSYYSSCTIIAKKVSQFIGSM